MQCDPTYPAIDINGNITPMSRATAMIFVIILPLLAVILAAWTVWKGIATQVDVWTMVGMYVVNGFGVTVGYHRLFTHRSFEAPKLVRYTLAVLGAMAAEGAPIVWSAQHRQHHAFSDILGDPHSPFLNRKPGFWGAIKALAFAHYGHIFFQKETIDPRRYTPDLEKEPFLLWMEKYAAIFVIFGFVIPAAIGWTFTHTWTGAAMGLLWGGLVRLFLITHSTGAVNSICHFFGSQRFDTGDQSRNVWWLVPFTLGESWHNGHHAFPTSARHGLSWWEFDPSWISILVMEKLGLARNVIRIKPEHVQQKMIKGAPYALAIEEHAEQLAESRD